MIAGRPEGANTKLTGQGVMDLHVQAEDLDGGNHCILSVWEPTPDEIEAIRQGAKVCLRVLGTTMPAVMLTVGKVTDPG